MIGTPESEHIDVGELRAIAQGLSPVDIPEEVLNHLDECAMCATNFEREMIEGDSFATSLRAPDPLSEYSHEIEFARVCAHEGEQNRQKPFPFTVGDFQVVEEISRGGMGVVYLAKQRQPQREVALKMIQAYGDHRQLLQRFEKEWSATAMAEHAHIVKVFQVGEDNGQPYYTMELMRGGTLEMRLQDQPISMTESVRLLKRLADATAHAHSLGIVHRDLKPANVLFANDELESVKLADFGVAKIVNETTLAGGKFTTRNAIVGTLGYIAPEQAWGDLAEVNETTDVFALGAILYRMLTAQTPYPSTGGMAAIEKLKSESAPNPVKQNPAIPKALAAICKKCLNKHQDARYESALALSQDLAEWLAHGTSEAWRHEATEQKQQRLWKALRAAAFAALIAVATWAAIVWFPRPEPDPRSALALERLQSEVQERGSAQLVAGVGSPRYYSRKGDTRDIRISTSPDKPPVLWTKSSSLLALYRVGQANGFRFKGSVRHDHGTVAHCAVGVFVGYQRYRTGNGQLELACVLQFNEFWQSGKRNKGVPPPQATVRLTPAVVHLFDKPHEIFKDKLLEKTILGPAAPFQANRQATWRDFEVTLDENQLVAIWDRRETLKLSRRELDRRVANYCKAAQADLGLSKEQVEEVQMDLNGGIGIYARDASVSFRNVEFELIRN